MVITKEKALKLRKALLQISPSLDDTMAADVAELFPRLSQSGNLVPVGTRINWEGKLKRAAVDLWDTLENNPDNAPTLWEDILYYNGYRIIPEVITAGLAFSQGEKGYWNNELYESLYNSNVWNPVQFPAGWQKV